MGDHRASLQIKFTLHGKTYSLEWESVNWVEGHSERRVSDWFEECWQDAYARWHAKVIAPAEQERAEREERAELARLLAKYGT